MTRSWTSTKISVVAIVGASIVALAAPAAARASHDVSISQTASAQAVKPGGLVTITVNVTNLGTEAANPNGDGNVNLNLYSWGAHGRPTNNPYQSVTPSQGSCNITPVGDYQNAYCTLGPLAPGASAKVTAVVRANESADHFAQLLGLANSISDYSDDTLSNDHSALRINASSLALSGSKKLKLKGLPDGCASGDFTLKAVANVTGVWKIVAKLSLGFDQDGIGQTWQKAANGKHLRAKVPISRIFEPQLGKVYKLKIKAKRRGGGGLKRTVEFELC
jgi:hypothetical protein